MPRSSWRNWRGPPSAKPRCARAGSGNCAPAGSGSSNRSGSWDRTRSRTMRPRTCWRRRTGRSPTRYGARVTMSGPPTSNACARPCRSCAFVPVFRSSSPFAIHSLAISRRCSHPSRHKSIRIGRSASPTTRRQSRRLSVRSKCSNGMRAHGCCGVPCAAASRPHRMTHLRLRPAISPFCSITTICSPRTPSSRSPSRSRRGRTSTSCTRTKIRSMLPACDSIRISSLIGRRKRCSPPSI